MASPMLLSAVARSRASALIPALPTSAGRWDDEASRGSTPWILVVITSSRAPERPVLALVEAPVIARYLVEAKPVRTQLMHDLDKSFGVDRLADIAVGAASVGASQITLLG